MSASAMIATLWNFDDPAGSEARFRAAHQAATDPAFALELLTQVARAQGLQQQFDAAHATLDDVLAALETGNGPFAAARVRYLLERGRVFNSSKQRDKAMPLFELAWQSACRDSLDALAVDAAHMIAIVCPSDQALDWNLRAIALAEESSDPIARDWLGSLHNNVGWTHHGRGDFELALQSFNAALKHRQIQGKPREIRIARWCIGRVLRSLGRIEESLAIQQQLHEEAASPGGSSHGFVHEELAECLLLLDRPAEAAPHFAAAHRLLSTDAWLARDEPARLDRLARLGNPAS